ncbi:serine/threonine protein kinase [Leptothrix cholodnii SP-6]|uniref:Serine/threonine protein kinase n=1 Tax=Leptothrix cholodnii (strain ATCC 51168 / LMG 8142 / SP-6) TaxID=395495 RepID=B1Y2V7_LEPCP|nr:hypothetical protein [Leptothrix cholodnii]ACB34449.1 serine/threonine protein kinase [Leptothrix cholodnii SP-6]
MNIAPNPAAVALHTETQAIKARLAASEQSLQAAHAAAAEPKPDVQAIGPGELETARLSDLAGLTVGRKDALLAQKTADAAALTAHAARIASAKSDVATHDAAVRFHAAGLAEVRKLELAALSAAAEPMVATTAQAYANAVQAMRAAAVELSAVRAVAHAAYRQRMNDQIGHGDLGAFDAREVRLPIATLGVLGSDGTTNRAATAPDVVHINGNPSALVETIVNTLKGLA